MIELRCKQCNRFLADVESIVGEIICGNSSCAAGTQFKIVAADESQLLSFKFPNPPRQAKTKQVPSSDSA
jgi:phage FluMu protein Com